MNTKTTVGVESGGHSSIKQRRQGQMPAQVGVGYFERGYISLRGGGRGTCQVTVKVKYKTY